MLTYTCIGCGWTARADCVVIRNSTWVYMVPGFLKNAINMRPTTIKRTRKPGALNILILVFTKFCK